MRRRRAVQPLRVVGVEKLLSRDITRCIHNRYARTLAVLCKVETHLLSLLCLLFPFYYYNLFIFQVKL